MNKQALRQIISKHVAKQPLDPRVLKRLDGYRLLFEMFGMMSKDSTTAAALKQQLLCVQERLPDALDLCKPTGEVSAKDFILYLRSADTLISRLHDAMPAKR